MKIHILSDLHLEFGNYQPPVDTDEADVIVLPGDIWKKEHGIHWARATFPSQQVIYVPGNHEYYGAMRGEVNARMRIAARETGVHLLNCNVVVISGVRFLGATLWTDFELFGSAMQEECMACAQISLSDFRAIHEGSRHFSPMDSLQLHNQAAEWVEMKLKNETFDGPTVVVTHHAPSWTSVVPRWQKDLLSACFASRLEHLLGFSELWIHGHTHSSLDYIEAGTRVLCNPRGYLNRGGGNENPDFNPMLTVEL